MMIVEVVEKYLVSSLYQGAVDSSTKKVESFSNNVDPRILNGNKLSPLH